MVGAERNGKENNVDRPRCNQCLAELTAAKVASTNLQRVGEGAGGTNTGITFLLLTIKLLTETRAAKC